jgi:presenilin-like A22 family membrane protease
MKHSLKITFLIVLIFLCAQIIGLVITNAYIDYGATEISGELTWKPLPGIGGVRLDRPDIAPKMGFLYNLGAILAGTVLILLIIHWGKVLLWKLWFFLAIVVCLHIAFGSFAPSGVALVLALVIGYIKAFKHNFIVHNFSELFIYGGLAVIFVPILNVLVAIVLMLLLSVYDAYAVWKSKHMIEMAKFQTKAGVFAGLLLPYHLPKAGKKKKKGKLVKIKMAILGGGDIGFPLLFAGAVLKQFGFAKSLIIPPFAALALLALLLMGKKKHFYPAIPFLTVGCFVGLLIVWIISGGFSQLLGLL